MFDRVSVGQENNVANHAQRGRAYDEDGTLVYPLRDRGNGERDHEGHGIRRNRHELRGRRCIAQLVDDRWLQLQVSMPITLARDEGRLPGTENKCKGVSWWCGNTAHTASTSGP